MIVAGLPLRRARRGRLAFLALAVSIVHFAGAARAATFTIDPISISLSTARKSALLTIENTSGEPLRFELGLYSWAQNPSGEMDLGPTSDIVFFPALLTIPPAEKRVVRIGTEIPSRAVEKTYRLFVEELPPLETQTDQASQATVKILTKMGVPVFIRPEKPVVAGRIAKLLLQARKLSFEVENSGNVHFVVQSLAVTGRSASGKELFKHPFEGWYVLAGGSRVYELELSEENCAELKSLSVEARTAEKTFDERLDVPPDGCRG